MRELGLIVHLKGTAVESELEFSPWIWADCVPDH